MDLNTLLFGGLAVVSLAVFLFLGRFKASKSQTERDDRIDWSTRQFSLWKIALFSLCAVLGLVFLTRLL